MIITCPNCQTRYQVAFETIGSAGRKVQCASCRKAWQASAEPEPPPPPPPRPVLVKPAPPENDDRLFADADEINNLGLSEEDLDEADLDNAFTEEEQAMARIEAARRAAAEVQQTAHDAETEAKSRSSALAGPRDWAYSRRQAVLFKQLPFARVRRIARATVLLLLIGLITSGISLRTDIVRQFPELAPVYEGLGLGVNVVGLEFRELRTVISRHKGAKIIEVEAKIYSASKETVAIPKVVVTLLDKHHSPVYEWSVTPDAPDMEPGEVLTIKTQVTAPPDGAEIVRLTFSGNQNRPLSSRPTATRNEQGAH